MRLKQRIPLAIALTLLITVSGVFIYKYRYQLLFYYYVCIAEYRDVHAGKYLLGVGDDIKEISPHIIPMLENIYKDTEESRLRRHAAAIGLTHAEPERAIILFSNYLYSQNAEVLSLAILNLSMDDNGHYYKEVTRHINDPDPDVRRAVEFYIEENKGRESE